jgi:hypothetical protein
MESTFLATDFKICILSVIYKWSLKFNRASVPIYPSRQAVVGSYADFVELCYPMKKSTFDILSSFWRAQTDDFETKPAAVPAFVQFGETEILSDLSRHWNLDTPIWALGTKEFYTRSKNREKKCYNLWRDMYWHRHLNGTTLGQIYAALTPYANSKKNKKTTVPKFNDCIY